MLGARSLGAGSRLRQGQPALRYWDRDGGHQLGYVEAVCTAETFRPVRRSGYMVAGKDWEECHRAHEGMWPRDYGWTWWPEEEWRKLYSEGYRYCDLLVTGGPLPLRASGRALSTSGR